MRHRIHPARPATNARRNASDQRRNDNLRRLRAILFRRDRRVFSGAPPNAGTPAGVLCHRSRRKRGTREADPNAKELGQTEPGSLPDQPKRKNKRN